MRYGEKEEVGMMPSIPVRIQRRRTRGWRMPPNTKYCGRGSRFGNPFHTHADGYPMSRELAVSLFRDQLEREKGFIAPGRQDVTWVEDIVGGLRGSDLACWCPLDEPCHADVLLEIANEVKPC